MKQAKIWMLSALLVIAGASFGGCSSSTSQSEGAATQATTGQTATGKMGESSPLMIGTAVGNTAPDFQLARTDGSTVKSDDLRGQPAVLVFWTAWCPSCKEEAPHVNELAAQFEPRGVRVLGINIQDSPARLAGGVKEFGIKYGVASDADAAVARRYKVVGTPTIVFLDEQGIVRYFGNELPEDYAAQLDALLAKA